MRTRCSTLGSRVNKQRWLLSGVMSMAALISCLAAEPHTGELIDEARWVSYLRFSAVVGAEVVQQRGAVEGIQRRTQRERELAIGRLD